MALAYRDSVTVLPPAEGRAQRCSLLDALADADDNDLRPLDATLKQLHHGQLRQGQVIVVAPDADRLSAASLNVLRGACRHLSVVTERELPHMFEDDPLGAPEQDDAA